MTYKIINLAIDALLALACGASNSDQFNRDVDDALKALKKVKKYL